MESSHPSRLFLIGFMGSGKSTFGKKLAEQWNYMFIDLDERIIEQSGKSIPQIFQEDGEDAFREMESSVLKRISETEVIVATGGGTPLYFDNLDWMQMNGQTCLLNPPVTVILERLSQMPTLRPMLGGRRGQELEAHIQALYLEREPTYKQAQITISDGFDDPAKAIQDALTGGV